MRPNVIAWPVERRQPIWPLLENALWLGLALWLFLASCHPVWAQEPTAGPPIQRLRVQVMPEFDDPRVLVVVQGRFSVDEASLPLPVTFRLPRQAQINQMATMDMSTGSTASQPYQVQPDPDDERWSLVSYSVDNAHFFFEFYYDPIQGQVDKQFTFVFSSLQPVEDLALEVQQPLAATNLVLTPAPSGTRMDQAMGFTYHRLDVGALEAGGEVALATSYTKTDPAPSISHQDLAAMRQTEPSNAMSSVTTAARSAAAIPTWVYVLFGGITLIAFAAFVWTRGQTIPVAVPVQALHCVRCGAGLKEGALFCHSCGASIT
ncbi:MAG: zinc ribbon domain-containing protein [Chloroflexota bacterium]